MQDYALHIKASAAKELDAIDTVYFERIKKKILALASNPRRSGSKKLKGHRDYWRIRIGDFRVIYT
jgi:mRNA interferase RelE/StbE